MAKKIKVYVSVFNCLHWFIRGSLYFTVIKSLDLFCLVELNYVLYQSGLMKLEPRILQRPIFLNCELRNLHEYYFCFLSKCTSNCRIGLSTVWSSNIVTGILSTSWTWIWKASHCRGKALVDHCTLHWWCSSVLL